MKKIGLTSEEEEELEKRGFLVKNQEGFNESLDSLLYFLFYLGFLLFLIFFSLPLVFPLLETIGVMVYLVLIIPGLFLIKPILLYLQNILFSGKIFLLSKDKTIDVGLFSEKLKEWMDDSELKWYKNDIRDTRNNSFFIALSVMGWLIGFLVFLPEMNLWLPFIGAAFFLLYMFRLGINIFHPLYVFGNVGMKIQKLTPDIESQSEVIQSEFEKDQNFSILHAGFEKLSLTFSKIIELVLKLERIEQKANKGNLFDSVKYINSLRTDIVTPLVELKKFLEGQREALLQSQKELIRVIVGESSELSGNRELATKRGEELLQELDGNIEKLNIMITKLT